MGLFLTFFALIYCAALLVVLVRPIFDDFAMRFMVGLQTGRLLLPK